MHWGVVVDCTLRDGKALRGVEVMCALRGRKAMYALKGVEGFGPPQGRKAMGALRGRKAMPALRGWRRCVPCEVGRHCGVGGTVCTIRNTILTTLWSSHYYGGDICNVLLPPIRLTQGGDSPRSSPGNVYRAHP